MSARILEGTKVAQAIDADVKQRSDALGARGTTPTLSILRIGERPDDVSYEKGVMKRAEAVGIAVRKTALPADVEQKALVEVIEDINADASIHGLLMFRPLPDYLDEGAIVDALHESKDVDSGTHASLAASLIGTGEGFAPCTPQACIEILDHYGIDLEGKEVVVVGRSLVVGKPLSMMLLKRNATVVMAHSRTRDLPSVTRRADIVIACAGRPRLLGAEHLSSGQTVLDVGINFDDNGKMCGDANFDEAIEIVDAITPVPRGVGSVTTSVLCKHVIEAAERACADV